VGVVDGQTAMAKGEACQSTQFAVSTRCRRWGRARHRAAVRCARRRCFDASADLLPARVAARGDATLVVRGNAILDVQNRGAGAAGRAATLAQTGAQRRPALLQTVAQLGAALCTQGYLGRGQRREGAEDQRESGQNCVFGQGAIPLQKPGNPETLAAEAPTRKRNWHRDVAADPGPVPPSIRAPRPCGAAISTSLGAREDSSRPRAEERKEGGRQEALASLERGTVHLTVEAKPSATNQRFRRDAAGRGPPPYIAAPATTNWTKARRRTSWKPVRSRPNLATLLLLGSSCLQLLACSSSLPPPSLNAPRVGAPVPDFTLTDDRGQSVGLSSLRGHQTVLVFYRGFW